MGLLDFIFGKTKTIQDDFFGKMTYVDSKNNRESYFECRRNFLPINEYIEIGIEGDEVGPTIKQKAFFKEIEDRFSQISETITPLIEDEFRNWKEDFKIKDFKQEFKAVYLRIPRCDTTPIIWEIAFESEHDLNHIFTITMNDFNAKEILIDG